MEDALAFNLAVDDAIRTGRPSSGANLAGMLEDFSYHISMLPEIDDKSVKVKRTGVPRGLLDIRCRRAKEVSVEAALMAVRHAWLNDLRYEFVEAHRLEADSSTGRLFFLTQMSADGLFVTGALTIGPN